MDQRSVVTPAPALDFTPLRGRPSWSELREFRRWAKSTRSGWVKGPDFMHTVAVVLIIGVSLVMVAAFTLVIVFGAIFVITTGQINGLVGVLMGLGIGAFVVFCFVRLIEIWRRDVRFGVRWGRWYRLNSFAEANDMVYLPHLISPDYPGSPFLMGEVRRASDIVARQSGRYVEIGNYEYSGETGLSRSLNRCGYIRVELDRRVPHLYLRSRKSRRLGETFARSQEFALEGDFGKHFRVYAPGGV